MIITISFNKKLIIQQSLQNIQNRIRSYKILVTNTKLNMNNVGERKNIYI